MIKFLGGEWPYGNRIAERCASACDGCGIDFSVRWGSGKLGGTTLVLDLGWFKRGWAAYKKRPGGYYQIGVNHINWLPDSAPGDRWESLNLPILPPRPQGKNILAIGQVADDSQHGLTKDELVEWLYENTPSPFRYRPHPQSETEAKPKNTLEHDLEWADVVLTYNSTVGLEALRLGIPVICSTNCFYAGLSGPQCPSVEDRLELFQRIAYAQWTEEEIEKGVFLPHYFKHLALETA